MTELLRTYSRYDGRTVTVVFVKWPSGSGAGVHPIGRVHQRPVSGVDSCTRRRTRDGQPTVQTDRGSIPHHQPMDSPNLPPLSASHVALPYMGIKRTAPRDWSRPGTKPATAAERIPNDKRYQRSTTAVAAAPSNHSTMSWCGGGVVTCPSRHRFI